MASNLGDGWWVVGRGVSEGWLQYGTGTEDMPVAPSLHFTPLHSTNFYTKLERSPFVDVGVVLSRDRVLRTPKCKALEIDQARRRPLEEWREHNVHQAHLGAEKVLDVDERSRAR